MRKIMKRVARVGGLAVLAATAGCAQATDLAKAPPAAPELSTQVRRTPFAQAEGFAVVRLQAENWLGCTAIRRVVATDGAQEGAHIGLVRLESGQEMLALGGIDGSAQLGERRQVPVRVDVAGQSDTGTGWLEDQYFNAFTSADPMPALLRGSTAVLHFDGGFTVGRRFRPGVLRELSRCYSETLVAAGLEPGGAGGRVAVARPASPQPTAPGLTPDVAAVRLD
jgi:hypothetical protein